VPFGGIDTVAKLIEHGLPVVNWQQAQTLQALHEGRTAESVRTARGDRRDTFYRHTRGLRERGLVSAGKRGQKGSVRALVKPREFLIKGEVPLEADWLTGTVVALARVALKDESACPILADALQEAGCAESGLLELLREQPPAEGPLPQVRSAPVDRRAAFVQRRTRLLHRIVN
jgi:hypothetical protein